MLRAAHKQLAAAKLVDLLSSCPLVLVYQSLGSVRSSDVSASVQELLDKQLPSSGLRASCLQVKNSVARASPSADISRFLQANSLLLGWQVPEAKVLQHIKASRDTEVDQILQLSQHTSLQQQPKQQTGQQLRQQTLATLIDMGIRLPDVLPVALLASFYQGQQVKLKHLQAWKQLDERQVQADLLAQLDAIAANPVLELEAAAESLHATLDAGLGAQELVMTLDLKAQAPAASS